MSRRNHFLAFDKTFFASHQRALLWLLNTPGVRAWFRWVLRISGTRSSVAQRKILNVTPNAITWQVGYAHKRTPWATFKVPVYQIEFRTHAKYAKRLYRAFRPLWWVLHFWDWLIADRFAPALSFGFDTLTVYPDANPETTSVDGWVTNGGTNLSWATIHDAATGSTANDSDVGNNPVVIQAGTTAWNDLRRGFYLFDTSALDDAATITAATLSFHGGSNGTSNAFSMAVNVYSSTPASNTALATGDFDAVGTTAFSTAITVPSWADAAYNDYALNASGLAAISKTGVSKFSLRSTADATNTEPTHSASAIAYIGADHAENAGTTQDPKLVVTYNLAITYTQALPVTATAVVTISKIRTWVKSLTVTAAATVTISKAITFLKTLSVTATAVVSIARISTRYLSLAVTATSVPSILKQMYMTLAVNAAAVLNIQKTVQKLLTVTATAVPAIVKVATYFRSLAATATAVPLVAQVVIYISRISPKNVLRRSVVAWLRGGAKPLKPRGKSSNDTPHPVP